MKNFLNKNFKRGQHKMAVNTNRGTAFKQYKTKETDAEKEWGNLKAY
jgi:hypothetical protein